MSSRQPSYQPTKMNLARAEPINCTLPEDFDAIPEAEDELRREVMAGHSFSAEIQGRKSKS